MAEQRLDGWQVVQFGEIANQISKRVEPSETKLGIYVGLEHLDPESLKIRRYGSPSDISGQKLLVKKGQIIFGKRRAYQRKIAVADWDCICSAHAMVLEENPKTIAPGFLPFFMQSNLFMNRAVAISEGSLSPTIKWSSLARQAFLMPPISEQKRLLPLLSKLTNQESQANELCIYLKRLIRAFQLSVFDNYFDPVDSKRVRLPKGWTHKKVGDLLLRSPESGTSLNVVDEDTGKYVLNLNCLTADGFKPFGYKPVSIENFIESLSLKNGDILISRSNTKELVGLIGIYFNENERQAIFPDTMWRLEVNEKIISKEYLANYLLSPYARREIQRIAAGTSGSMKKINKSSFNKINIPVPSIEQQIDINEAIQDFQKTLIIINEKIKTISRLKKSLVENTIRAQ